MWSAPKHGISHQHIRHSQPFMDWARGSSGWWVVSDLVHVQPFSVISLRISLVNWAEYGVNVSSPEIFNTPRCAVVWNITKQNHIDSVCTYTIIYTYIHAACQSRITMVCHVPPEVVIEHAGRFPEAYGELSGCEICALPHYEENLFLFQICLSYKYIYIYIIRVAQNWQNNQNLLIMDGHMCQSCEHWDQRICFGTEQSYYSCGTY